MKSTLVCELKQIPLSGGHPESKRKNIRRVRTHCQELKNVGKIWTPPQRLHGYTMDFLSKFPTGMIQELRHNYGVTMDSTLSTARKRVEHLIKDQEDDTGFTNKPAGHACWHRNGSASP